MKDENESEIRQKRTVVFSPPCVMLSTPPPDGSQYIALSPVASKSSDSYNEPTPDPTFCLSPPPSFDDAPTVLPGNITDPKLVVVMSCL